MTWVEYTLFYFVFAILILSSIKIAKSKNAVISLNESYVIKGIAINFIVIAHWVQLYIQNGGSDKIVQPFMKMGVFAVAVFFCLSGYGLSKKENVEKYWYKKLTKLIIPYIILNLIFNCIIRGIGGLFTISFFEYLGILKPFWFIAVLIIDYFFWWINFKLVKKKNYRIVLLFVELIILLLVLLILGKPTYWYNSNIAFGVGVLIGTYECELKRLFNTKWLITFIMTLVLFLISAIVKKKFYFIPEFIISNIMLAIFCFAIFLIMDKFRLDSKIISVIGKRSMYIYIIHIFILDMFGKKMYMNMPLDTVIFFVGIYIVTFISYFVLNDIFGRLIKNGQK